MIMPNVKIFLCSASEDEDSREKLEQQLAPYRHSGFIQDIWYSQKIEGGMEKNLETQKHLHASQIIVLLVSPNFMNTNEYYDLMLQAMDRHTKGEARVVPVLLRPVGWAEAPFSKLQALPKNEKPITSWSNREEAFLEVAQGIFDIIKKKDDASKEEREAKETEASTYLPVVRTQNTALTAKTSEEPSLSEPFTAWFLAPMGAGL
jgi:TIR domain